MKTRFLIVISALALSIASTGCRGEDSTLTYNYIGGTGKPPAETPADEGATPAATEEQTPALGSEELPKEPTMTSIGIEGCNLIKMTPGKGFVDTQGTFNTKWTEWCPGVNLPDINLLNQVVAYVFVNLGGCEDVTWKGVRAVDGAAVVDIEKTVKKSSGSTPCYCPLMLKMKRMMYAIEKTEGTPTFNETTVEVPCE